MWFSGVKLAMLAALPTKVVERTQQLIPLLNSQLQVSALLL